MYFRVVFSTSFTCLFCYDFDGDAMRKKIIVILLAVMIGSILAFFTFIRLKPHNDSLSVISLYVLQTGVFQDYQNALEQKNSLEKAIIYQDGNYYRVIVGASNTESGLAKIETILTNQNIHYYKKMLTVLENSELFLQYNMLLEKASNDETVLLLNCKILDAMEAV